MDDQVRRNVITDFMHRFMKQNDFSLYEAVQWRDRDVLVAFSAQITETLYVHVIFECVINTNYDDYYLFVRLIRSSSNTPKHRPRPYSYATMHHLFGLLPPPPASPLPFILSEQHNEARWWYRDQRDLHYQLRLIMQRLEHPVLAWLRCEHCTQAVLVHKAWYVEIITALIRQEMTAAQALQAAQAYQPPQFYVVCPVDADTELVNTLYTELLERATFPWEPFRQGPLEYLAQCFRGERLFQRDSYTASLE